MDERMGKAARYHRKKKPLRQLLEGEAAIDPGLTIKTPDLGKTEWNRRLEEKSLQNVNDSLRRSKEPKE